MISAFELAKYSYLLYSSSGLVISFPRNTQEEFKQRLYPSYNIQIHSAWKTECWLPFPFSFSSTPAMFKDMTA